MNKQVCFPWLHPRVRRGGVFAAENKKEIAVINGLMPERKSGRLKIKRAGGQTNKNYIIETDRKK